MRPKQNSLKQKILPLKPYLDKCHFKIKSSLKNIRESEGFKPIPTNEASKINKERQRQFKGISVIQQKAIPSQIQISPPQTFQQKGKSYHQLNPLSIDRTKYDAKDLKIGGNKIIPESRVTFASSNPIYDTTGIFKNIPTPNIKPRIVFGTSQTVTNLAYSSSPLNFIYQNVSLHKQSQSLDQLRIGIRQSVKANKSLSFSKQRAHQNGNMRYELRSVPIYQCQTQHQEHDSGCTKNNESTHYYGHNTSLNEPSYYEQTQQFFNNIQIIPHAKRDLQNSTYSNYSEKYRNYMEKELIIPSHSIYQPQTDQMPELMQNVRIQVVSVNQEQNQKNQTNFSSNSPINNLNEGRQQRKGSYSSSFMVIEGKQKEIESTKKIYLPSNADTCSIQQSGLIHQLDQFMVQDFQIQQNINYEMQSVSIAQIPQFSELQEEVHTLCQTFNHLLTEEQQLKQEKQRLCSFKMHELQQEIKQLEALKIFSEERCQQIDSLKQLIKVKLIKNRFSYSPHLQHKYLDDQKGWERYISHKGDSLCLNDSNQTTYTQN